ncbi:ATP-binding protein [Bradyrhizobium oligotrophicum]|uniref:ATP-binding protein n=1 Tax=Bradyrhizobium oligotrophicum TaxID=44255 RepID=UPI003EBDEC06
MAGYTVQFTTATTLVEGPAKAHSERRLDEKLLALSKPKLLTVDELGCLLTRRTTAARKTTRAAPSTTSRKNGLRPLHRALSERRRNHPQAQ